MLHGTKWRARKIEMEYTLYKPNKKETGGAVKFNLHSTGKFSFMKAAAQCAPMGSKPLFSWDDNKAINVKMTEVDLGAMMSVIFKMKPEVQLFHQTERDNKIIVFAYNQERKAFSLKVSHKVGNNEANSVFVSISIEEAMILKVYIENTIRQILESNVWAGNLQ